MSGAKGKLSKDDLIRQIAQRAFRNMVTSDENLRCLRRPFSRQEQAERIEETTRCLAGLESSLARNDSFDILAEVSEFLEPQEIDEFRDLADITRLYRECMRATISATKIILERDRGNYDNAYDQSTARLIGATAEAAPQPPLLAPAVPAVHPVPPAPETTTIGLKKAIDDYVREQMTAEAWTAKTKLEYEVALKLLLDYFGDLPLTHFNHQRLLLFRDSVLARLPKNREKMPKYRGLTLADLLKLRIPDADRMLVNTLSKYMRRICGLFSWAHRHQYVAANPATSLEYRRTRLPYEERAPYSPENLQKLVEALVQLPPDVKPWKYWTPLVSLYCGIRQCEIGQLNVEDIVVRDGIACFDINKNDPDKKLKEKACKRLVPLHPHLVELGFMDYVEKMRKRKVKRLWPELKKGRDGYGTNISKWYCRWRLHWLTPEDVKRKIDFHALRHTFDNGLKQAGVLDMRLVQLMGHSLGKDQTFGRYGDMLRPPQLLEAYKKFDHGLDLAKLKRDWS